MPRRYASVHTQHKLMLDASAIVALFDPRDQYHDQAIDFRDNFIRRYEVRLFTTNYVYSEAMSHLTHLPLDALKRVDSLIRTPRADDPLKIEQLWVDQGTVDKAIRIYFKFIEHDFSINDCTCFVLMQENGIRAAFTFDDDYNIYSYRQGQRKVGFWKLPEKLDSYASIRV